jgi:DNA-binding LacI/PurR family transcriptional regulator
MARKLAGPPARLSDIAREAGVTTATVSYALSGLKGVSPRTRQRILDIARRMNYVSNRQAAGLRQRRTFILGLSVTNIRNPFFAEIVCAVESTAAASRYRVMLCVTENDPADEQRHLMMLLEHNVDALILVPVASDPRGTYENLDLLRMFESRGIPIMCIVNSVRGLKANRVTTDVYQATRLLADHLLELGHRDIAYFSQPFTRVVRQHGRHAAYRDALREAGVPFRPELLVETGVTPDDAYEQTGRLLDSGVRFTAAMYPNDYMAIGGVRKLRERGVRVPEDVSVAGLDDVDLARFCEVPLTTARFPMRKIGELAVGELIARLESSREAAELPSPSRRVLPAELVVRRSTGRARP